MILVRKAKITQSSLQRPDASMIFGCAVHFRPTLDTTEGDARRSRKGPKGGMIIRRELKITASSLHGPDASMIFGCAAHILRAYLQ